MLEDDLKSRDIKVTGFGMPACVAPELADRMRPFVTSVVHREDAVPRLSFTNLVKLSEAFNQDQEREWCKKQLAVDVDGVWEYLGFSKKDPPPPEEVSHIRRTTTQSSPGLKLLCAREYLDHCSPPAASILDPEPCRDTPPAQLVHPNHHSPLSPMDQVSTRSFVSDSADVVLDPG